ncbi:hypothetical protein Phi17218_052 [Cellulophaga phage phi17:2_18]|uniref:Right handed beta helix domain-containing protein n=2 Tax=Lightbulbvirus Cba172 TaxID=1918525 RepID=R9ZYM2_9CAUD|nr:hypothetical protein Phi17:2_gp052 [Cellulophaga phage phi17:2]AGO47585.1 hypothetical protein Phi17:2_gp052 [Cellulophaga phage phi17:2]ALO80455.1 hypothetical protein Phi17218_052 [Cellulophaga phage phi17:2_18]
MAGTNYIGPYDKGEVILLSNQNNITISGLAIGNSSTYGIRLYNCTNIVIENCYIYNCDSVAISTELGSNITIRNNIFEEISTGVYCQGGSGIQVTDNDVKNVKGPFPRGQLVQFAGVTGANNKINDNSIENISGESYAEDAINLFQTYGTESSPIEIARNYIRGGGPSGTGGGIMTGDNGGSYVEVYDNILVDPGQYGIAISSGQFINIHNNIVYGREQSFTNVGIYAWEQYGKPCSDNRIANNRVHWTNKNGTLNHRWDAGNCGVIADWNTNTWGDITVTEDILPEKILSESSVLKRKYLGENRVFKIAKGDNIKF